MRRVNVDGTRNMLQAAHETGVRRFIYTSTIHALKRLPHGVVIDENTPFDPENPYGAYDSSKAQASILASRPQKMGWTPLSSARQA